MALQRDHFGVYAIIERANRFLLVTKTRGPYTGMLDLPGGKPEFGENPLAAVVRELAEELALHVSPHDLAIHGAVGFEVSIENGALYHKGVIYRYTGDPDALAITETASVDTAGSVWAAADDPRLSPLVRAAFACTGPSEA